MSISYKVLGFPGRDNALYTWINSGKRFYRILFDCGEDVLKGVTQSDAKSIDYIFLSHCHIDHIAGFDYFFRRNYDQDKSIIIYGPPETSDIVHNRLKGFKWNLVEGLQGEWIVNDIYEKNIITYKFKASEGFKNKYPAGESSYSQTIVSNENFHVDVIQLNHIIPSIGYIVKEYPSKNINKQKLDEFGLTPGAWLERLKDPLVRDSEIISQGDKVYSVWELRNELIIHSQGESIAYLTDFIFDENVVHSIPALANCNTLICESQYLDADKELAKKNYHLTSKQAAEIALRTKALKLILFHISDRYASEDQINIFKEAREVFPESYFPEDWNLTI